VSSIVAIGGGANSDLLLQIMADVWGVPLIPRDLVDEATALGAAVVGGVGIGMFDRFEVAQQFSRALPTLTPNDASRERYKRSYGH
jgi:xylulokinase